MGVLENPGKVLDFLVSKRVGTLHTSQNRSDLFPGQVSPHVGSRVVRIDLFRFLAGCRTR